MSFSTKITKIGTNLKVFNQSVDSITPSRTNAIRSPSFALQLFYVCFICLPSGGATALNHGNTFPDRIVRHGGIGVSLEIDFGSMCSCGLA
jgi:hypothetical protein